MIISSQSMSKAMRRPLTRSSRKNWWWPAQWLQITRKLAAGRRARATVMGVSEDRTSAAGASFGSAHDVAGRLRSAGYLPDDRIAAAVFLGARLEKPVLVEGPAGTGKTELAKSVAALTGARLVRLQCYEGLDEAKALYEWDYRKQLLRIQAGAAYSGPGGRAAMVQRAWTRPARAGRRSRTTSSASTTCSPARCWRRSARRSPSCCSSTRSTGWTSRPRRCCWRSCRTTRSRSPSSAR